MLFVARRRGERARVGLGARRVPPLSAAARHVAARLRPRPSPRDRRRPHRGHRQRHAKADARRPAPDRHRLLLLARPFDRRRARVDRDRRDGDRARHEPRVVPRRRRPDRHAVSALFLLAIAVMNLFILASVYRAFHRVKNGGAYVEEDLDVLLTGGGLLARIFRPLFGMVRKSWHMYPLGLLFGLGFDTATEIGLLGISAAEAAKGMSIWSILVFPALFTAGHVARRHGRQRADARRVRLGVHQAD